MNLIINLDHDGWILSDHSKTLAEVGAGMSGLGTSQVLIILIRFCVPYSQRNRILALQP
jgi:hypothetical protein